MAIELHDAEFRTESWRLRHSPEGIALLGAWRWKGVAGEREYIEQRAALGKMIDFGGSDGPIGNDAVVVDRDANIKTLADVSGEYNTVFTSHTLEHCSDLAKTLEEISLVLTDAGVLIAHVPAWTCLRWRAGCYSNPKQSVTHYRTFGLTSDVLAADYCARYVDLDRRIQTIVGPIIRAYHCGDDSLMIIAQKA